ncbi:subtilisin, putative [Metarhizium acridum CQMa 102]|uniref:Subtilisin, putative n=1 Tax=Metarhizium acridum (strain CQMa 102) TaxID=655827 RepID=E9E7K9_METAQ|nr:subtilisin, putative [Metarhizium acridum CQMa 102]EFY88119.1 subtilisin, putative [Metarhizium acridum CQMa 102]
MLPSPARRLLHHQEPSRSHSKEKAQELSSANSPANVEDEFKALFAEYEDLLKKPRVKSAGEHGEHVLFTLLENKSMYDSWSSWCNGHVGIKYFLKKLLGKHHHLLDAKHPNLQYNTLAYALVFKQHDFIDVVLQVNNIEGARATLVSFTKKTSEDNTPVHEVVQFMREEATEDILKDVLKEMLPQEQMEDDSSNGEQSEARDEDQGTFSANISEGGTSLQDDDLKDDESEASSLQAEGSEIEAHEDDEPNTEDDKIGTETPAAAASAETTSTNLSMLIPALDCRLLIVEDMLKAWKMALKATNKAGRTPYQERIERLKECQAFKTLLSVIKNGDTEEVKKEALRKVVVADPVAQHILAFCVREFDNRDDIVQFLYQSDDERHLDFDLAGLPKTYISLSFLRELGTHIRFESVLKYVALPMLSVELPKTQQFARKKLPQAEVKSMTDLRAVFEWLRQSQVKKIIKVTVIDYGGQRHSDPAIEEALRGFDVEVWDWKKVDLCSDVIFNCASSVREISLYPSGNGAALMGWSGPKGFGNRKKFPKGEDDTEFERERLLTAINNFKTQLNIIHRGPKALEEYVLAFFINGLQSEHQTFFRAKNAKQLASEGQSLIQRLKTISLDQGSIAKKEQSEIEVKEYLDTKDFTYASDFRSIAENEEESHPWIGCLDSFRRFLCGCQEAKATPMKIAIIHDGIDASDPSLQRAIAMGKSFSHYPNSTEFMNAYFVPSGKHGTQMAKLITQICADPRLFIARLEERLAPDDSGRRITAESAAKAVMWAVDCKVDIISMSWTIENGTTNSEDIEALRKAVKKAHKQNILMFCSTSDSGGSQDDRSFPGQWLNECTRIGGASHQGQKLARVNEKSVQFLLPGKRIPIKNSDGKSHSYETGSSLATACASGLAGLLLHCERLLGWKVIVNKDKMHNVFKVLVQWGQFPHVRHYFDKHFKKFYGDEIGNKTALVDIPKLDWDNETRKALENLMTALTTHISA